MMGTMTYPLSIVRTWVPSGSFAFLKLTTEA